MTTTHEHRPDLAAQRAALAVARAELTGDHEAAIGAAEAQCGVCLALTVTNYWIGVAAILDGNRTGMVTERVRRRLLAAADAAEAELRAAGN